VSVHFFPPKVIAKLVIPLVEGVPAMVYETIQATLAKVVQQGSR
jgi:hypothetical protein